ncbi:MAG: glycerophosphoryl diester phosphodiesterase [Nocardioidaceae bacterium]|nr:glycerophosphoryl diester phosphodiesterase [Nocardioidaceae bacterium]
MTVTTVTRAIAGLVIRGAVLSAVLAVGLAADPAQADGTSLPSTSTPASLCPLAANRGIGTGATEDGLTALKVSAAQGSQYLEFDVRATKDQHLMLMNRATVDRTTNGKGAIASLTARKIRSFRLADGGRVPYVTAALHVAAVNHVGALVEVKAMGSAASYRALATAVSSSGVTDLLLASSDTTILSRIRSYLPKSRRALIASTAVSLAEAKRYGAVEVNQSAATDAWVHSMRSGGIRLFAYSANSVSAWARLSGKVNAVITSNPRGYDAYRTTAPPCQPPGPVVTAAMLCPVAAHRGDHATETEDGIRAMQAAADDGADYLEFDVSATMDMYPVLMHDPTVDRTTNGTGAIKLLTFDEVRALQLDDGEQVPTLAEALKVAAENRIGAYVELKNSGSADYYQRVADAISASGVSHIVVDSFDPARLDSFHAYLPAVKLSLLTSAQVTPAQVASYGSVQIDVSAVSSDWLDAMAAAHIQVTLWTVDSPDDWNVYSGRVASVITNDPVGYILYRSTAAACRPPAPAA